MAEARLRPILAEYLPIYAIRGDVNVLHKGNKAIVHWPGKWNCIGIHVGVRFQSYDAGEGVFSTPSPCY